MSVTAVNERSDAHIVEAIAAVYDAAEIMPVLDIPRIVPLERIISAHSLWHAELLNLTRRSAIKNIDAQSGRPIAIPADADIELAGFLYAWPYRSAVQGCLFVEQSDLIERRRFSAAHELGHYVLHFRPKIQSEREQGRRLTIAEGLTYREQTDRPEAALPDGTVSFTRGADSHLDELLYDIARMEKEANQFAAELLMPEAAVRALMERYGGRASARRLATEFLVSIAAMRWRLKNLGFNS
jgi:hypothetical protein